eukprot:TRINITY_DN20259_c0_g6_i1.p1 TRINITY_DN20259_c0_g6~~TRINITY_DN20259_c0_g6_i1.p1  ORF type:complete len:375 (-),score=79.35 TRINITY_DN20259_c0_g6_i1:262-1323(-)
MCARALSVRQRRLRFPALLPGGDVGLQPPLALRRHLRFCASSSSSSSAPAVADAKATVPATSEDPAWDVPGDIFRCAGIEGYAVQMRRRVQLGLATEVIGTQVSNFLHHNSWEQWQQDFNTFYYENSALLLGVHVFMVWKYHAFLRDALLARHITRIAIEHPSSTAENKALPGPSTEAGNAPGMFTLVIETGPWTRRVLLGAPATGTPKASAGAATPGAGVLERRADEEGSAQGQQRLGDILQMGLLHVDRSRGEVVDEAALQRLLEGRHTVIHEEVTTDFAAVRQAYVSPDAMVPFLAEVDVGEDSAWGRIGNSAALRGALQWSGGRALDLFGKTALAMGAGSILLWAWPKR